MREPPADAWRLALVLALLNAYALPTLGFGLIAGDDDQLLRASLAAPEPGVFWRFLPARPVWVLSYPLVGLVSDAVWAQRLASLALWNACAWIGWRWLRGDPRGPLVLLAVFLHPALLFPLAWIAQRSDLLLILFAALALEHAARPRGLVYLALSLLAKGPFVLHAPLFALWLKRDRAASRVWVGAASAAALALAGAVLLALWQAYYAVARDAADPVGLYQIAERDAAALAFVAASRAAKLVEGAALALAPLPAYYGTPWLVPAALAYAFGWGALAFEALRGGLAWRGAPGRRLALAAAMTLPLAFGTGLRVLPPLVFPLYLGLLPALRFSRLGVAALGLVVAAHAGGALLNYRFSDTGCHDPANAPADSCAPREVPIYRFAAERQQRVDALVRAWRDARAD